MSRGLVKTIKNIKKRSDLIITPKLEVWLQGGNGLGVDNEEDLKLAASLLMASKANDKRDGRFGASSRGMCKRRQVFAFLGMPGGMLIEPQLQNIFNDGTFRHIRWQLMLKKAGIVTDVEVPFQVPEWRLGLSMDAVNEDDEWVFELKGTSANISGLVEPQNISEAHLLQIHTYLFATGWDRAVYLAESKMSQQWAEVVVPRDEQYIRMVKRELNELNEAVEDEQLPEVLPDCRTKKGQQYRDCPYKAWCIEWSTKGDEWPRSRSWEQDGERQSVPVGRRIRRRPDAQGAGRHDGRPAGKDAAAD